MITVLLEQIAAYLPLALGAYISFNVLNRADLSIEAAYLSGALTALYAFKLLPFSPLWSHLS